MSVKRVVCQPCAATLRHLIRNTLLLCLSACVYSVVSFANDKLKGVVSVIGARKDEILWGVFELLGLSHDEMAMAGVDVEAVLAGRRQITVCRICSSVLSEIQLNYTRGALIFLSCIECFFRLLYRVNS